MLKKQQQKKPWKNEQKIYLKERYLMPRNKFHISTKKCNRSYKHTRGH